MAYPLLEALNRAAAELPEGWRITIEVERDSGDVLLHDPDGTEHEFPCNRNGLASDVIDALDYAIDQHSGATQRHVKATPPTEPQITAEQWNSACAGLGTKG